MKFQNFQESCNKTITTLELDQILADRYALFKFLPLKIPIKKT